MTKRDVVTMHQDRALAPEVTRRTGPGYRVTVLNHGEWWTVYVVLRRPVAWRGAHALREAMDRECHPVTPEAAYSPTGRAFWREPYIVRRRRVVAVVQDGGMDV